MIFCSVVMMSSNAPKRGASPPRPLRAPPRLAIRRGNQDTSVRLVLANADLAVEGVEVLDHLRLNADLGKLGIALAELLGRLLDRLELARELVLALRAD